MIQRLRTGGWRRRAPGAIALTTADAVLTVGQAEAAADEAAGRLMGMFPEGGCLLLPSADPPAFLTGLMACSRAGLTAVPWRERSQSLATIADVVRPDGVLRLADGEVAVEPTGSPSFDGPRVGDLIMMTSGSTGAPKGVALSLDHVMLNAVSAGAAMDIWRCNGWTIDIDLALMSALSHMVMAWQFDLPLHHLGGREPAATAALFRDGRLGFGGSPVQLVRLRERLASPDGPTMMVSSGDFLPPAMIDEIRAAFPESRLHKLYGLTELAGRFCCMPHDQLMADKAAVGWPLPGARVRIAAAAGEIGEVEALSPLLMAGYYRPGGVFEPQAPGWLPTGDLGFEGADNALTLVGRADDVIKVGGEKVDRQSIEQALSDLFPDREYCVLGVEHPLLGQCPALFVSNLTGAAACPGWAAIVAHIRSKLPSRYIPGLMYGLDCALPRLANGKIDREALKSQHRNFSRLR